jgi:copper chaperone
MTTHELRIEGMSCGHCVKTVEEALRGVPGVTKTEVRVGAARVETDASVTKSTLVAALAAVDYAAS